MGIRLFIASILIAMVMLPLGLWWGIVKAFYHHDFRTGCSLANHKMILLATALDKYGNVVCAELFNAILITKGSAYPFGHIEQTISQVIGYNLINGTLSKTGKLLNSILNFFEPNHSLKAINQA